MKYYFNQIADRHGYHEVHSEDCIFFPPLHKMEKGLMVIFHVVPMLSMQLKTNILL